MNPVDSLKTIISIEGVHRSPYLYNLFLAAKLSKGKKLKNPALWTTYGNRFRYFPVAHD